jgi:hypothetical protein
MRFLINLLIFNLIFGDYWVNVNGQDVSYCGTTLSPCKTLHAAILRAGNSSSHTFFIASGTYVQTFKEYLVDITFVFAGESAESTVLQSHDAINLVSEFRLYGLPGFCSFSNLTFLLDTSVGTTYLPVSYFFYICNFCDI